MCEIDNVEISNILTDDEKLYIFFKCRDKMDLLKDRYRTINHRRTEYISTSVGMVGDNRNRSYLQQAAARCEEELQLISDLLFMIQGCGGWVEDWKLSVRVSLIKEMIKFHNRR